MKKLFLVICIIVFSAFAVYAEPVRAFGGYKVGDVFENKGYKGHKLNEVGRNDSTVFYELDNYGYAFKDRITLKILVDKESNTIRKMDAMEGNR